MTFEEFIRHINGLSEKIRSAVPGMVAETAGDYFKESFTRKGFDGKDWAPAKVKKQHGSLLVNSSKLLGSIHPAIVSPERVVISAGGGQVTYARVHNEGYEGEVDVAEHDREIKIKSKAVKGKKKRKPETKVCKVRAHTRNVSIVKRQFMGEAVELNKLIYDRISGYLQTLQ